ncbi:MAG: YdcF family protein [Bacillota bacterium]|nr:YdcF family protein [Bacillota bacterium]
MSIPLIGDSLIHTLESKYSPPSQINGDVIIMLGGGATSDTPNVNGLGNLTGYSANRLLTCAQLYYKLNVPIIISGGSIEGITGSDAVVGKNILKGLGIPEDKIILESKSMNTTQNAQLSKEIVSKYGFYRPILVTSAFHMERAVRQFEKVKMSVTPYPTDYKTNIHRRFFINDLIPSADALSNINLSLKEYIGILAANWY